LIPLGNTSHIDIQSRTPSAFSKNKIKYPISNKVYELAQSDNRTHVYRSGVAFEGYNIFQFRDFDNEQYSFQITDMDGYIIDEFPSKNNYGYAQQINSTTFLLVSASPSYFWNIETGRNQSFNFTSHHDISYNPITKTFMTITSYYVNYYDLIDTPIVYRYDALCEMNIAGDVIWRLNTDSFVPFDWWSGEFTKGNRDITHSNTAFWDIEEDMIYLNSRNLNTFFKIDHSTGQVLWGLGEYGDFTLFDQWGNQRQNLFYHAHAVEKVDDDTFILFDNDYLNQTDSNNHRSRMLEITIDETTMTANVSWLWTGTGEYYSAYWGDADRLPNANRFGAFGAKTHDGTGIGPRLVEVNEFGHVVWEMYYTGGSLGIFKAERFRLRPTLSSLGNIKIQIGEHTKLSWQTWYNFRTRLKMKGNYTLYQEDQPIKSGDLVFDKFWRPTNLKFDIGDKLEKGKHNFTMIVADENGHTTEDKIVVFVGILPTTNSIVTTNSVTIPTAVSFILGLGIIVAMGRKKKELKSP
jgi:hypothetical protein